MQHIFLPLTAMMANTVLYSLHQSGALSGLAWLNWRAAYFQPLKRHPFLLVQAELLPVLLVLLVLITSVA